MSSRCKTFSASSAGASTRKGTWWGCSARPEFGRASPNGSSLGASSCRQISSRRWRRCPGKRVGDGSPIARSLGARDRDLCRGHAGHLGDRKSTRLNSSHLVISYAVFCLKKKKKEINQLCYIQETSSSTHIIVDTTIYNIS